MIIGCRRFKQNSPVPFSWFCSKIKQLGILLKISYCAKILKDCSLLSLTNEDWIFFFKMAFFCSYILCYYIPRVVIFVLSHLLPWKWDIQFPIILNGRHLSHSSRPDEDRLISFPSLVNCPITEFIDRNGIPNFDSIQRWYF